MNVRKLTIDVKSKLSKTNSVCQIGLILQYILSENNFKSFNREGALQKFAKDNKIITELLTKFVFYWMP